MLYIDAVSAGLFGLFISLALFYIATRRIYLSLALATFVGTVIGLSFLFSFPTHWSGKFRIGVMCTVVATCTVLTLASPGRWRR